MPLFVCRCDCEAFFHPLSFIQNCHDDLVAGRLLEHTSKLVELCYLPLTGFDSNDIGLNVSQFAYAV